MTNMNSKTRDELYPMVVAQQGGEYCVYCNKTRKDLVDEGKSSVLCIDVDDNSGNHSKSNLRQMQLLCKSCNTKKNHPGNMEPFHRQATPELILGKRNEKHYRRWVAGLFMTNENATFPYDYVVESGAEKIECSIEAVKNYLRKMTSEEGNYYWTARNGSSYLALKPSMKFH